MADFRYQLEPFEVAELCSPQRNKIKLCPCGKSNKDGKFVPFKGYESHGYCHSCDKTYKPCKNDCPDCGLSKVFSRYMDTDNGNFYLGDEVGKCSECGYHCSPSDFFKDNKEAARPRPKPQPVKKPAPPPPPAPVDYLPFEVLETALSKYSGLYADNHLIQWLTDSNRAPFAFTDEIAREVIERYYLGNSGKYAGWVVFPYIDHKWRVRQIKLMDYNPATGSRIKEPQSRVLAIGKRLLRKENANLQYCLFGEHLLNGNEYEVKIFESEATAIYCSVFYPRAVCLATGGKNGFKFIPENLHPLKGRKIVLYPDLEAYPVWEQKAADLRAVGLKATVSTLLLEQAERYAVNNGIPVEEMKRNTFDLRDVLKFQDWRPFRSTQPQETEPQPAPNPPQETKAPECGGEIKRVVSLFINAGFELTEKHIE